MKPDAERAVVRWRCPRCGAARVVSERSARILEKAGEPFCTINARDGKACWTRMERVEDDAEQR